MYLATHEPVRCSKLHIVSPVVLLLEAELPELPVR